MLGKHVYGICVADKMGHPQENVVGSEPLHTGVATFFLSGPSVTFSSFSMADFVGSVLGQLKPSSHLLPPRVVAKHVYDGCVAEKMGGP